MRLLKLLVLSAAVLKLAAATPGKPSWDALATKREALPGFHQEFEVVRTLTAGHGSQSSTWTALLDVSQGRWRESTVSGWGNDVKIFDGTDLLSMEEGGTEYIRTKHRPKEEAPQAKAYDVGHADWSKAVEIERLPCGIPGMNHQCVILEFPLKRWNKVSSPGPAMVMVGGSERVLLDTETGLLISSRAVQTFDNGRGGGYRSDIRYTLKRVSWGAEGDASLFRLPAGDMKEVKHLSPWDAARIKKQLAGKPAPDLHVTDVEGNQIALSAYKGKTILLDFWTTWCPPCRADGPALDKLYSSYGGKDLMIVGVSVSEERKIVEKFLREHPHRYPVVLTSENEMPKAYQIGTFPTYIVIDKDGNLVTATEGDKGFSSLRKMLKKAGLETE